MNQWINDNKWIGQNLLWIDRSMDQQINEQMNQSINRPMDQRIKGLVNHWIIESMN